MPAELAIVLIEAQPRSEAATGPHSSADPNVITALQTWAASRIKTLNDQAHRFHLFHRDVMADLEANSDLGDAMRLFPQLARHNNAPASR